MNEKEEAPKYNMNNPSIKRILKEMKEMEVDKNPQYTAAPLEDNIFEWHFTIRGPRDSPFEGGIFHGRILLPPEYPFKPPNIMLLTVNPSIYNIQIGKMKRKGETQNQKKMTHHISRKKKIAKWSL